MLASGSKDNTIILWDAKAHRAITKLHAHKNMVTQCRWNANGNWLLSSSRDQLIKVFDIRVMREMRVFRSGKREYPTALAWHPFHEELFAAGGHEGSLQYWYRTPCHTMLTPI
jgi:polyadenylation factor subunit 2